MTQSLRRIACLTLVALVIGAMGLLQAQPALQLAPEKALTQYLHDVWTRDDGLPVNRLNAVLQTSDGYLWLGTQEGLVRFDGVDFRIYNASNSGLVSSDIVSLHEDQRGGLWVGTLEGGVSHLQDGRFVTYGPDKGLSSDHANAVVTDSRGTIWAATTLAGLNRITADTIVSYRAPRHLPSDAINTLLVDRSDNVWIGTRDAGIVRFGDEHFTHFGPESGFPADDVVTIFQDRDGALWFGTRNEGLVRLQDGVFTQFTEADGLPSSEVLSIEQDAAGSMWIGTARGGLTRMIDGRFESLAAGEGLSGHTVLSIEEDAEGSLWVGTQTGGLNRFRDGKFTTYTTREGLVHDAVYSIHEDAEGNTWFGTAGGGASWLDPAGRLHPMTSREGLPSDYVISIHSTSDGSVWLGTIDAGLVRYRDGQLQQFTEEDGLPGTSIYALYEDSRGRLWIGTGRSGLVRYEGGRFTQFTTEDGLASNAVTAIIETRDGDLWVGTYDGGFTRMRGEDVVAQYDVDDGLGSDFVTSFYEGNDGNLWISTSGGLSRLRADRIETVHASDGLFADKVFAVLGDSSGRLWISCNRGLFYVERRQLDAFFDGRRPDVTSVAFDRHDGLRTTEFNGGSQPAAWRADDGALWFPSAEGAVRVDPGHLPANLQPPPVAIVAMQAGDSLVDHHRPIVLKPGRDKVEIRYAGLSYIASEDIVYQYRLEGVDQEWVEAGTRRAAFYTNLSPGTYTFRVRARNVDGVWSREAAVLTFELQPFFFQTRWFYVLALLGLIGLGFVGYRLRVRHLRRRQKVLERQVRARTKDLREEKEKTEEAKAVIEEQAERLREMDRIKTQFFNNISHEFRTPLTLNIGPLENALGGVYGPLSDEMHRQVDIMLRNSRRLLRLINQLLDLSKLDTRRVGLEVQHRDFVGFLRGLVLSFSGFAEKKRLLMELDADREALWMPFDPQALEKVFFNLLSNAVKFTPEEGRVTVELATDEAAGTLEVAIHDTGCGIPEKELPHIFDRFHQVDGTVSNVQEGTGIGLALVHEYVHLHGGSLRVESEEGVGTSFFITLPQDVRKERPDVVEVAYEEEDQEPLSKGPMIEMAVFEGDEPQPVPAELPNASGDTVPAEAEPAPAAQRASILVVDDNPDIRDYVASCLRPDYDVRTAENGRVGLEQIRQRLPDLVVSDVVMPEMTGYELCRAVRADEATQHLPVILLTSRASVDSKLEGLDAGADDYLTKPFNARELSVRVRNLLALREHQQALVEVNADLREAIEQKTNLLQVAAHDIRNPVGNIRELAKMIREEVEANESADEMLDMVETLADQGVQIISQMLEAEALETRQLELRRAPFDVAAMVEHVLRANRQQAERKDQRLELRGVDEAEPIVVDGDEDWLKRAVENLVSNAIKYSPLGRPIRVELQRRDASVRVAVHDEGPGLSEVDQERLFKKFERLAPRPTGGEASTGLGLAIVKEIASLHGGEVGVRTTLGQGSTFYIEVPLAEEPVA